MQKGPAVVQRKQGRQKKKTGRPPKNPEDKAVTTVNFACRAEEAELLESAMERLRAEVGDGIMDINRQLIFRMMLRRLAKHMASDDFSIVREYIAKSSK